MEFLIDFFTHEKVENTNLYPYLNCSKHEAAILREMIFCFMKGDSDIELSGFLETFYSARGFEILPYLREIKHLLELGWLSSMDNIENALELRNASVSLSSALLQLLEDGQILKSHIETREYKNALEYLQDEWSRLNLILKRNNLSAMHKNQALSKICNSYISKVENIINDNIAKNAKKFKILQYFEKHRFNNYEKLIFLMLAQAQYNGSYALSIKDIVMLGSSGEEKMALQNLLLDKSKLTKKGFIEFADSFSDFSFMEQEVFIPQAIFNSLVLDKSGKHISLEDEVERSEIFDCIEPKKGLDSLVLNDELKDRFSTLLLHLDSEVHKKLKLWGIKESSNIDSKILLHGDSGTGKTSAALALAKDLNQKVLSLDCSKILSMYVGESERNVRKIFDEYKQISERTKSKPILLLDEADQLLSNRNDIGSGASRMYHQMQNIFLEQIEKFSGILIATTNLIDSLDHAFSRRFHYKIAFKRPDEGQRVDIWRLHLPKNADFKEDKEALCANLAKFDLSGGQIKIVVENACYKVATRKEAIFSYDDFYQEVLKEQKGDFGMGKKMGFV